MDVHFEVRAYYYSDESPELFYKNAPKLYQVTPSDLIKLMKRIPPKCKIKTIEIDLNITHKGTRLGNSSEFLIDIMNYLNKFTKLISIHKTLKRSKLISDFKVKKKLKKNKKLKWILHIISIALKSARKRFTEVLKSL